jgi:Secretion system C-terminal sorting domain
MNKIILVFIFASFTSFAQITITGNDVLNIFAVGNSTTVHQDTLQSTVNIGSLGGGNNWNFAGLQSNLTLDIMSVNPATTPYTSNFAGADFCIYSMGFYQGFQAEIWTYSSVNGFVDNMGSATTSSSFPGFVITLENDPDRHTFQNPTTFGDQWMQTYTQTLTITGLPPTNSSVTLNAMVDAYGSMTLPGGATYDALRIREDVTISGITSVSYSFVSRSGAQVNISAVSSNPPTSGVIDAESTSYNLAIISSVEQIDAVPQEYGLSQNYPNPFNPTTNIEYTIPEASFVQLKVYDILGNEVATLVNEEQSAGTYRADFSGNDLASGMYIAKLQTGNYHKTIKMSLLK